MLAELFSILN